MVGNEKSLVQVKLARRYPSNKTRRVGGRKDVLEYEKRGGRLTKSHTLVLNNQMLEMRGGLRNHVARTKAVNESNTARRGRYAPTDPATNPLQGLAGVGSRAAFVMAQLVSGDDARVNRMLLASLSTAWLVLLLGPALKSASAACAQSTGMRL